MRSALSCMLSSNGRIRQPTRGVSGRAELRAPERLRAPAFASNCARAHACTCKSVPEDRFDRERILECANTMDIHGVSGRAEARAPERPTAPAYASNCARANACTCKSVRESRFDHARAEKNLENAHAHGLVRSLSRGRPRRVRGDAASPQARRSACKPPAGRGGRGGEEAEDKGVESFTRGLVKRLRAALLTT